MDNNEKLCNIIIENRKKVSVSGVEDVDSFDDETVVLITTLGTLVIRGGGFHINRLNVETGELIIEGDVDNCTFDDRASSKRESIWTKMFK